VTPSGGQGAEDEQPPAAVTAQQPPAFHRQTSSSLSTAAVAAAAAAASPAHTRMAGAAPVSRCRSSSCSSVHQPLLSGASRRRPCLRARGAPRAQALGRPAGRSGTPAVGALERTPAVSAAAAMMSRHGSHLPHTPPCCCVHIGHNLASHITLLIACNPTSPCPLCSH